MMPSLVIFDLDGTLVDSRRDIAVSVNHMLEFYGLPTLPVEVIESHVGHGAENLVRRSMGEAAAMSRRPSGAPLVPLKTNRFDIPRAIKVFRSHYLDHCLDTTRAFEGMEGILGDLRRRGVKLAVITNKPSIMTRKILSGLGLLELFDVVLGGDDVPAMKPDPFSARLVLERTGAVPDAAIMVGDSVVDVEFARAAGMRSVIVGYGGISTPQELARAGGDFFCRAPMDLRDLFDHLANASNQ